MKLAVIEPLQLPEENVLAKFKALDCEVRLFKDKPKTQDEILERCRNADIIVVVNTPISAEILEKTKPKMIAVSFTGYDHIDVEKCKELGVVVSNVPEYSTYSVAELVFGMVIAALRKLRECDKAVRQAKGSEGLMGSELYGKTMGVIGTGKIGSRVCELALAFGMNVLAYSRTEKDELVEKGIKYVSLGELLKKSDVVSVHLPLNEKTKHLIGAKELAMLKDGAIIVNAARGNIIKLEALVNELEKGRIFACLDVFDVEPPLPENHPLLKLENAILTPHIGYYTKEALERRLDVTIKNVKAFLDGKPINRVV
ncbi:MAG: hydroxyacid dehydrogenase [Archaeoglobus sp.]|nr:hydroxyacid dehydrogenase [Archaeoglobus sp.]